MNENLHIQREVDDKPGEECGVFGIYDFDGNDIAQTIYYGLFALQHRGQESCGIAVSDTEGPKGKVDSCKGMGLVNEVFDAEKLENLHGNIGVPADAPIPPCGGALWPQSYRCAFQSWWTGI